MITFVAFIFVLSLLVFVHELGHFVVAKLSGITVERFSIGLPPKLFGVRFGETDYCISMIPFGGYVKMAGQDDFDYDEDEEEEIGPHDYRGKPTIVKMAVLVAGSLMNLITAFVIFAFLFMHEGVPYQTTKIGYVAEDSIAEKLGFALGDEVIGVNGAEVESLEQAFIPLYTESDTDILIKNKAGERTITIADRLKENTDFGIMPYYESRIGRTVEDSPAAMAGIVPDDLIVAINGTDIAGGWIHMTKIIEANPDTEMTFTVERNGAMVDLPVTIGSEEEAQSDGEMKLVGKVGVAIKVTTLPVGPVEAVAEAGKRTVYLSVQTLSFFGKLISGRVSPKLLGGPVLIAQIAGESAKSGLTTLLGFTAFISINLGVLNLLPFPVLDGGHIAILGVEAIVRKKLSVRIRMGIQQAGSIILLLFMIYVTFNDLLRFDKISSLFGG